MAKEDMPTDTPIFRKPPPLHDGSRVVLLAPSSGLSARVPKRVEAGVTVLRSLGLEPVLSKSISSSFGHTSTTASERAREINDAFADKSVDGIICSIGGVSANALIDLLDYEAISKYPKVFVGFSDITVLQMAMLARSGLVSFQGPMVLTQFGEYPRPHAFTLESFVAVTFGLVDCWAIVTPQEWTDEFIEWTSRVYLSRARSMRLGEHRTWLRDGKVSGRMIGGCLPSLLQLRSTGFLPDFNGAVLLLELPEGHELGAGLPLAEVESMFDDLRLSAPFHGIGGVMIGRLYGYNDTDRALVHEMIRHKLRWVEGPVVTNTPFGHTDPIVTLPIGCEVQLDSEADEIVVCECATT